MKTLHSYVTRQVLVTLLMTVAVFTFVLLLASVLKEILGMLVNRQAGLMAVVQAVGLLIPFVMVFALPMGMLTAALLVFGRLSADNELTAVRASGVSLVALISPILLLSVLLSGVAAAVNMQVAPWCRVAYKELLYQTGLASGATLLPEKTVIKVFPKAIIYISKVDGTNLEDVLIYRLLDNKVEGYSRAESGTISFNASNRVLSVTLRNVSKILMGDSQKKPRSMFAESDELSYTNAAPRRDRLGVNLTDLTFFQLQDRLQELEKDLETLSPIEKLPNDELRRRMKQVVTQRVDLTMPLRVQMHRQVSFSFACLGFTLVGIPLGIRAHRRETTFGIAVALVLVVVYYSFFILGQALETKPELAPQLLLWIPNFIFQAVGAVLLWRANRGL